MNHVLWAADKSISNVSNVLKKICEDICVSKCTTSTSLNDNGSKLASSVAVVDNDGKFTAGGHIFP
jgi:hypothetical protein